LLLEISLIFVFNALGQLHNHLFKEFKTQLILILGLLGGLYLTMGMVQLEQMEQQVQQGQVVAQQERQV
jgi:hypothetical protein